MKTIILITALALVALAATGCSDAPHEPKVIHPKWHIKMCNNIGCENWYCDKYYQSWNSIYLYNKKDTEILISSAGYRFDISLSKNDLY